MGIIIKQSVRGAFWSYLGIAIGYINVGIIMPQFFDTAQIGLVQIFIALSLIFSQFATLGFTSVINRMFPIFRDPVRQHNGFLVLAMITGLAGLAVSTLGFFLLKPWIVESNIEKSALFVDYLFWLLPLIGMRLLFTLLDNYNKVLYDAVTGTFWLDFMHKLINLFLIILFALGWINFRFFFLGYLLSMSIPVFPVIHALMRRNEFHLRPDFAFLKPALKKEIKVVMLFGMINGFSGILLMNVDKVLVNQFLSLDEVGIFGVCTLFASLIKVPFNSIAKIATGIIADSWKRNDIAHIREIYQKSALNQAIVGTLIFIGILVNIDNILEILPSEYESGRWVIIIYSAGILFITIIGLAGNILEISNHYKLTSVFLLVSVLLQFIFSGFLIPRYGINGAASATVITLVFNYGIQAILLAKIYRISGISSRLIVIFLVGLISYLVAISISTISLLPNIFLRSGIVTFVYIFLIYFLEISPELNNLFSNFFKKMIEKWK